MKTCTKCNIAKPESDFYSGRSDCKPCRLAYCHRSYVDNRSRNIKRMREYYSANRRTLLATKKSYYLKNRSRIRTKAKQWRDNHPDIISARCARYYQENKSKCRAARKDWYRLNRDRMVTKCRAYHHANKVRLNAASRRYYQEHKQEIHEATKRKRRQNIEFRIKCNLSSRIRSALRPKAACKSAKTQELIGCSIEFLKGYLEARFKDGMSWSNYGKWHVDHRIPCAEFDLTDSIQQRKCFNYTNLQPLWGRDNQIKNARSAEIHQVELL